MQDLGEKNPSAPATWWNVFRTIFRYDPNSLVHGILFPAMGIKLSRVLTAHLEAFGADRVGLSGVKFDKLGKTTSGQPIFSVDKETAREIRATCVIDLSLLRSFGNGTNGLNDNQKLFLLELALWKIGRLFPALIASAAVATSSSGSRTHRERATCRTGSYGTQPGHLGSHQ